MLYFRRLTLGWFWLMLLTRLDHIVACGPADRPGLLVADWGQHDLIYYDPSTASAHRCNFTGLYRPQNVAVDSQAGLVFVTNQGPSYGEGYIARFNLDGSNMTVLLNSTYYSPKPHDIFLDTLRKQAYFTDTIRHTLSRVPYDGADRPTDLVLDGRDNMPYALVVDAENGQCYWSDRSTRKIESLDFMGENKYTLENTNVSSHTGMSFDICEGRIYWCNVVTDTVESIRTDGTGQLLLARRPASYFRDLVAHEDKIYITENGFSRFDDGGTGAGPSRYYLTVMPRSGGDIELYGDPILHYPMGIALYTPPNTEQPCQNETPSVKPPVTWTTPEATLGPPFNCATTYRLRYPIVIISGVMILMTIFKV